MRSSCMTHCLAICMKTEEQLYQRVSARPRVVLRPHSRCGLQDQPRQKSRSSWGTQSYEQSFRETGCNIVHYRNPTISLSTVQQQDEQRQHTVAKLIEKFESHQLKDQFLKAMSHRKNCCKIWTRQRSSNSVRILRNFNASIATPSRKSE